MTHASSLGERSPDTPHAPITCARGKWEKGVIARVQVRDVSVLWVMWWE